MRKGQTDMQNLFLFDSLLYLVSGSHFEFPQFLVRIEFLLTIFLRMSIKGS